MRVAKTPDNKPVEASPSAPKKAVCPRCGGTVVLRGRRTMGSGLTWYWQHKPNQGYQCRQGK